MYFQAIELAAGEVEKRFDQKDIRIIEKIESILLDAANGKQTLPEDVQTLLADDIDQDWLKIQLTLVKDMIRTSSKRISQITSVRSIASTMDESSIYKGMLSEVDKLLRIYLTFPTNSATAERSFSALRRIKTFLRSTMTHCRLNNLFLLYVHQSKTDKLDLCTI